MQLLDALGQPVRQLPSASVAGLPAGIYCLRVLDVAALPSLAFQLLNLDGKSQ